MSNEIIDLTTGTPARFRPHEIIDLTNLTPETDRRPVRLFSLRDAGNIEPVDTPIALANILADDVSLPTLPTTLYMEDTSPLKRARIDDNDTSFDYDSDEEEEPIDDAYPNRIWQAVGEEKYN